MVALAPSSATLRRTAPSAHYPTGCISRVNHLFMAANNDVDFNDNREDSFRTRIRQRLSHMTGSKSDTKSTSLFPQRTTKRNNIALFQTTLPTLMFLLLQRITTPSLALASSSAVAASSTPVVIKSKAMDLGRKRILSFLQSFWTQLRKQNVKSIIYVGLAIVTFINIVETIMARNRQKLDATSEWGRYADKPAARGMALSILMMRLTPYTVLPTILEKVSGNKRGKDDDDYGGYNTKEEYESSKAHNLRNRGGQLFADGLLRLGPLYIKIGQILSCRENLFPKEWISAMEKLQDRVPAKSGEHAWSLAYEACPGGKAGFHQRFTDFDDVPLAAASLGQVHKARLRKSGERVAIKIQRPRLRDIYDKDLALMKKIAKVVDSVGKAGQVGRYLQ